MISSADLIAIHELLIAELGGMRGITEAGFGRLEGVVAAPLGSAFGAALFPGAVGKAAALCYAIVRTHPFSDGNKRVGLVVLDVALAQSGHTLTATNDAAYAAIMAVAQGKMSRDDLITWAENASVEF